MIKKSLTQIAEDFVKKSHHRDSFTLFVEEVRTAEQKEENRRNSLLDKYSGVMVVNFNELDTLIHKNIHDAYEQNPFLRIADLLPDGEEASPIFKIMASLLTFKHNRQSIASFKDNEEIVTFNQIPIGERIEKLLEYGLKKNLKRHHITNILRLKEDYETAHNYLTYQYDDNDDPEMAERDSEIYCDYPYHVMELAKAFMGSFQDVKNYVLKNSFIKFLPSEMNYSNVVHEKIDNIDYFIFQA